ncbi:aladin-like [Saccoglossus kowalevskii]|uniref:Aladin-like n=1 Tax=Saccoglossus kowalevskii TaxID=10224 RepID=A0ABM0MZH9_SACKO|nr:PREDICTED: aladin-like [Saccoglossus kowalevskii]
MSLLLAFSPPPPADSVTVCELNSELMFNEAGEDDIAVYLQGSRKLNYPKIEITSDSLRPSSSQFCAKSAFLEHSETVWKRSMSAWYERGVTGLLEEIANSKSEVSPWLTSVSCGCLALVRWANSLHGSLFPHLVMSSEEMVNVFSSTRDWYNSPVRSFAWHPYTMKFAIACRDDSIRIHTGKSEIVPVCKHKLQKGIAMLVWKPLSASVLAVACHSCILVWHIDPTSVSTRPSSSSVQILSQTSHSPVTQICWHPSGDLLLSASPTDTAMMVWNVAMETCVPLRRLGGGGVSLLRWSPDGSKVFAATPSSVFRVWESQTWSCERWSNLSGRCQSACWSPLGDILLFTVTEEPVIYSLPFHDSNSTIFGSNQTAVNCVNLAEITMETEDEEICIGGSIQDMAWDPTGERLAILFSGKQESNNTGHLVALFRTRIKPVFEIMPCGFVKGHKDDMPQLVSFQPNFNKGALLTICWLSGRVSFVPLFFVPSSNVANDKLPVYSDFTNGSTYQPRMFSSPH